MQTKDKIEVQIESISPEKAKLYLAKMGKNRHLTQHHLMGLVRDMKGGDPRHTARNWIIRRPKIRHGRYNPFTVEGGNLLIRAWNAWRGGEQLVKIQPMKEPPIIK
jgi:hypothetical protein